MNATLEARDLRFRFPAGFTLGPVELRLGVGLHWLRGPNGAANARCCSPATAAPQWSPAARRSCAPVSRWSGVRYPGAA